MERNLDLLKIATVLAFFGLHSKGHGQTLQHAELLGRPTDHSVTIQLIFSDSAQVKVEYGTTSGNYTDQTPWSAFGPNEPAEIQLDGLSMDTRYYYQVRHRVPGGQAISRPERTFHTQRAAGSSFTFVVQADPHLDANSDSALYRLCLQNQLDDSPDLMIDLGDFLMSDKLRDGNNQVPEDTVTYRCHLLRSFYETTCHSVPLFNVMGNHEGETGWYQDGTADNVAIWSTNARKMYFLNPAPDGFYSGDTVEHSFTGRSERYFEWQWGDAQFIVLDPYWYSTPKPDSLHGWRWTLGETQYNWLKTSLENSTATYKFVFAHQLVGGSGEGRGGIEFADKYEWGGNNIDGTPGFAANRPGWYAPLKDLLTEHRATIFFHGHDHFFGQQQKDCLIYQETPQPSLPNFQNANQADDYGYVNGVILPNAGHLRVNVSPDGVQVEYVRAYLPQNENANRHNKDVSASYFIGPVNCYDTLFAGTTVLWNDTYSDELVYPNPFQERTTIAFSIDRSQHVDLRLTDINGRWVRTLIADRPVAAGAYRVVWDGNDGAGAALPDGVYLYSLQCGGVTKGGAIALQR